MADQFSLPGLNAEPHPTDRLFFALFPDPKSAELIRLLTRSLRSEHHLVGKPLAAERFHVTLYHLGDYEGLPPGIVADARAAAAAVEMPPFDVAFNRVGSFGGPSGRRPFVLRGDEGLAALTVFRQALGTAMRKAGLGRWAAQRFTPQLTLLYDDRIVAERSVESVGWTAGEFVLVHSLLGRTRHIPLERWPLRG